MSLTINFMPAGGSDVSPHADRPLHRHAWRFRVCLRYGLLNRPIRGCLAVADHGLCGRLRPRPPAATVSLCGCDRALPPARLAQTRLGLRLGYLNRTATMHDCLRDCVAPPSPRRPGPQPSDPILQPPLTSPLPNIRLRSIRSGHDQPITPERPPDAARLRRPR